MSWAAAGERSAPIISAAVTQSREAFFLAYGKAEFMGTLAGDGLSRMNHTRTAWNRSKIKLGQLAPIC
jgi:hypothetical protein